MGVDFTKQIRERTARHRPEPSPQHPATPRPPAPSSRRQGEPVPLPGGPATSSPHRGGESGRRPARGCPAAVVLLGVVVLVPVALILLRESESDQRTSLVGSIFLPAVLLFWVARALLSRKSK